MQSSNLANPCPAPAATRVVGRATLVLADCFDWLGQQPDDSIHAIVTDPPYGLKEYDSDQLAKRAQGHGGIWRIPPSFDGARRAPLPRFTALNQRERSRLFEFFKQWGQSVLRPLRPGAHVMIAT
ncbi:MAG: site-specific DNA-methyltransferase, partial [Myxococcota bacterium]